MKLTVSFGLTSRLRRYQASGTIVGMTRGNHDRITNLIVSHMATSARLAEWFLRIASCDPRAGSDITGWRETLRQLEIFEAQLVALCQDGDYSWDMMAAHYDVKRQSLHRRLAKRCDLERESAQKRVDENIVNFSEAIRAVSAYLRALEQTQGDSSRIRELASNAAEKWPDYCSNGRTPSKRSSPPAADDVLWRRSAL